MSLTEVCQVLSLPSFPEMIHNGTQIPQLHRQCLAAWDPIDVDKLAVGDGVG